MDAIAFAGTLALLALAGAADVTRDQEASLASARTSVVARHAAGPSSLGVR
jgi:hypothetical protein